MMALLAPAFDASGLLSELLSFVGPEVAMLFFGALTYILFSDQNMLAVYWSYVSAWLLPLDTVEATPMISSFAATTGAQAKKMIDNQAEKEEGQDDAPEDGEQPQQTSTVATTTTGAIVALRFCNVPGPDVAAAAATPPAPSVLIEALTDGRLSVDLVANVFLGLELKHLGSVAATCRAARANIWDDAELWLALGGPLFAPAYQLLGQAGELHLPSLRSQFRIWVYGLDSGSWGSAFAERAACRNQVELFEEAAFLLGGIQETEDAAQIQVFGQCLVEQLALLDAGEDVAARAAAQLLAKAQARCELLGELTLCEMRKALDESVEYAARRALAAKAWEAQLKEEEDGDIRSPFDLDEVEGEASAVESSDAGGGAVVGTAFGPLALSFLAALVSRQHRSVDVVA